MLKKELPHHYEEENGTSHIQEQLSNIDNFQTIAEIQAAWRHHQNPHPLSAVPL